MPHGDAPFEVWHANGPVERGREPAPAEAGGDIQWATDGQLLFGAIAVDEAHVDGITAAAEHAYARMTSFVGASQPPHLLRVWNYLAAPTFGHAAAEPHTTLSSRRAPGLGDPP